MSTADIIQDLVDDAEELDTDIGNAYDEVQTKGGTVPQNKNTNNLATAIASIPTGAADNRVDELVKRTLNTLETDATSIGTFAFYQNAALKEIVANEATSIGNTAFFRSGLESGVFKKATALNQRDIFYNSTSLKLLDFWVAGTFGGIDICTNCPKFNTLIIRRTNAVATLSGVGMFAGTPFRNGTGGTIYVPQALLSTYQSATNWSALESTTFLAIEGSIYE